MALSVAAPALAADPPPPAAAPWSWSGFYLGGHGGYGWSHDATSAANDPFFTGKFPTVSLATPGVDPKGFLGGFHAGANWQAGTIVGGLEIDLSVGDIKASARNVAGPIVDPFSTSTLTAASSGVFDVLGSGRGRLGYLVRPDVLIYGTGGLAWTHYVQDTNLQTVMVNNPPFPSTETRFLSFSSPTWRLGWVAGLGGEARLFNSNWLARLEYLHYDFGNSGSSSALDLNSGLVVTRASSNLTVDVVRAGLSYKFDPDRFALGYAGTLDAAAAAPFYKAPSVTVPWTWAGFYLGAHGGYGWAEDPFSNRVVANVVPLSGVTSKGFVGGFQAGANWQSRSVVGGLEIDLSGTGIKGSASNAMVTGRFATQATQTDKFDPVGSARVRIGYLVTPGLLLYGTGGLGWTRLVTDQDTVRTGGVPAVVTSVATTPNWLMGWVAGLGLEARLGNTNWLGRVEYLHYDFGSGGPSQIAIVGTTTTVATSGNLTADLVRAGLSYKLNGDRIGGAGYAAMPVKAPVAAVWSWSGFYVGGHAGYGWGRDPFTAMVVPSVLVLPNPPPVLLTGVNSQGYVGGFQAGANWQFGNAVGGAEIDLSKTDVRGSISAAGVEGLGRALTGAQTDKFDLLGSARARVGYLVLPEVLLYGTGGLAWTRLEQTATTSNSNGTTVTFMPSWRFGWTAGAGGQVRLWNSNWLARLEYLHYDFGGSANSTLGVTNTVAGSDIQNFVLTHRVKADVVRAGIDYKFD
jgi:outer membrane immunogenic protein